MRKLLSVAKDKLKSRSRSRSPAPSAPLTPSSINISAGIPTPVPSPNLTPAPAPLPSTIATKPNKTVRNIAIFRTVLSVIEKALDGLPIYGPKAVVAAVSEILKSIQLKLENEASISDIESTGHELGSRLESTSQQLGSLANISPDLKRRVDELKMEIEDHLGVLGRYAVLEPVPSDVNATANIKRWLRQTEQALSAEMIAKELPEVNQKIMLSLQKFMVDIQIRTAVGVDMIRTDQISQDDRNLLDRLSPVKTAFHDNANATPGCLSGTRVALLETVTKWFGDHSPDSPLVMWLSGNAGTGKTSIAHSVCDLLKDNLGATFFFSRDEASRRHPTNVIPTITYQLAYNHSVLQRNICDAIKDDPDVSSKALKLQADKLITGALSKELESQRTLLFVLDALDECDKENGQEGGSLIPLLFGRLRLLPFRVKVFITSRPEASIQTLFNNLTGHIRPFVLHDIEEHVVQNDIERYLRYAFAEISRVFLDGGPWPGEEVIKTLVARAGKLFIYAATIVKYTSGKFPERKLERFLSARAHELGSSHSALDHVYTQIIRSVISDIEEADVIYIIDVFKRVIGAIVTLQQPLGRNALSKLVSRPANDINEVLQPLYSLLEIGDLSQGKAPIRIFHPSFPDFISNQDRCPDARLRIDRAEIHPLLLSGCFSVMETQLKQDICRIGDPSLFNSEVPDLDRRLDEHISEELGYACTYWMVHLVEMVDLPAELFQQLMRFCVTHLLHWVECLSLLRRLQSAAEGLPRVLAWLAQSNVSIHYDDEKEYALVTALLNDALRVIREYWTPITASALQVYHSALVFMPECELYCRERAKATGTAQLISARHKGWNPCLQVLENHSGSSVSAVAFSPDDEYIASGLSDGTVHIWSSVTGEMSITSKREHDNHRWECNDYSITTVAYSPDGLRIFSGTNHGTIKALSVVDATNTWIVAPLKRFVDFESDSDLLAELEDALYDQDLYGEDSRNSDGEENQDLDDEDDRDLDNEDNQNSDSEGNQELGDEDNQYSDSENDQEPGSRNYQAWDKNDELKMVTSLAISPDGSLLACVMVAQYCGDSKVYVYDFELGAEAATFLCGGDNERDHKGSRDDKETILAVTFTQAKGGFYIVSASSKGRVCQWDIKQKGSPTVLSKDYFKATIAAFSSDGLRVALGSEKGDIQIRDYTRSFRTPVILYGHTSNIRAVCFSNDGSRVASGSDDYTVRIWEAITGDCLAVLKDHSHYTTTVAFSFDGLRLASGGWDSTIRIWDATTRWNTRQIKGHTGDDISVAISTNGSRVALSDDSTIRLWSANTGKLITVFENNSNDYISSVVLSPDGSEIIFGDEIGCVKTWNADTGEIHSIYVANINSEYPHFENFIETLASSPDGSFIVVVFSDHHVRILSRITKLLKVEFDSSLFARRASFSSDNARLALGDHNGNIEIWDILGAQATQILTLSLKTDIFSLAFSFDDLCIIITSAKGVQVYSVDTGNHIPVVQAGNTDTELRNQSVFWCDTTTGWLNYHRADIPSPVQLCWLPVSRRPNSNINLSWSKAKVATMGEGGLVWILDFSSHPLFKLRPAFD